MALNGLHVVCERAGGIGPYVSTVAVIAVHGPALWSETLASPATTTNVAASSNQEEGQPFFSVWSSADAYIAIGPTPNASTGTRRHLAARTPIEIAVKAGDKLAWILA